MSEKIQPGDLVMVVKPTPCCGASNSIGEIHRVASVQDIEVRCNISAKYFYSTVAGFENGEYRPIRELKRIPPLDCEDVAVKDEELVV